MRVGLIGIGNMGSEMAGHLLAAGNTLTTYARSELSRERARGLGLDLVDTASEVAATSEVVFTIVTAGSDVEAVVLGSEGIVHGAQPGLIVVDMSTISPGITRRVAELLRARDIAMLDAPVWVRGEVVGINTFLVSGSGGFQGMGFAIPSHIVEPTVASLIKYGKVRHGYIGIGISDVTPDQAKFFKVKEATGAVVTQVESGTPGAKAGLKVGDVITKLDGEKLNDAGQLQVMVQQREPGTTVELNVVRDGKPMKVSVKLEEFNKRGGDESANADKGKPRWGLSLSDLTPQLRQQLGAGDDVNGAVIQQVVPASPADNAGLRPGMVITEVNRLALNSAADVHKALTDVPQGSDALVLIWSRNGSAFRVLRPPQE